MPSESVGKAAATRVVFVHGACVRDGAWWWDPTAEALAERGIASVAATLPSCGETARPVDAHGPGLADDVAAVREILESSDLPTIVVGHSYGGIVVAQAAAGVKCARHLLLVSSYLPEVGESLSSFGPAEPAPFIEVDPDGGTFTVQRDALVDTFLQDCSPQLQQESVDRIAAQSLSVLEAPVQAAAWKAIPSTYLLCEQDRGTSAERQREYARRATHTVSLDAGHHPFLSQPAAVADLVEGCFRDR